MVDGLAAFGYAVRGAGGRAGGGTVAAVHAELLARWSEPQRRYHTRDHLRATLSLVDGDPIVVLAIWGHDAVYDPRATGDANEERSAQLTNSLLSRCSLPGPAVAEVARLIRLTAGHAIAGDDVRGAMLADADLAVLAAEPTRYDRYALQVRAEYAHVPDDLWRAGRGGVLRRLLAMPRLYHRHPEWEKPARANLRRELAELG